MQETIQNFELCEEIGRSHTSRVYRAIHRSTSRVVAIKVISPNVLSKKSGRVQWDSETKFHCLLKHDNVLQCYDFFIEADHGYLVMEYVNGFNLRECIRGHPGCTLDQSERFNHLIDTAEQICKGLMYLHDQEIIHGHIKPENVLVSQEVAGSFQTHKQVKVSDFALSGRLKGFFRPSTAVRGGTLGYMSPEQIRTKRATFRSDIFSLGVTLYELFTGHSPWGKQSGKKGLLTHMLSPKYHPPLPSRLVRSLPKQLDTVIMKMLEKDEKNRHSTVAEIWVALHRLDVHKI